MKLGFDKDIHCCMRFNDTQSTEKIWTWEPFFVIILQLEFYSILTFSPFVLSFVQNRIVRCANALRCLVAQSVIIKQTHVDVRECVEYRKRRNEMMEKIVFSFVDGHQRKTMWIVQYTQNLSFYSSLFVFQMPHSLNRARTHT